MSRIQYNWLIRISALVFFGLLLAYVVNAEIITTTLTIDNTIYPQTGECIKGVCQEIVNNTKYVRW